MDCMESFRCHREHGDGAFSARVTASFGAMMPDDVLQYAFAALMMEFVRMVASWHQDHRSPFNLRQFRCGISWQHGRVAGCLFL